MSTIVHHAIDVAAAPDRCWRVLSDLTTWSRWFPMARYAAVEGADPDPWRIGGRFQIVLDFGPVNVVVKTRVEECAAPGRVRWVGRGWGITGDHAYLLESKHPGLTRVTSHEEFSGPGSRLISGRIKARIDDEVHRSMERFKALVEGQ